MQEAINAPILTWINKKAACIQASCDTVQYCHVHPSYGRQPIRSWSQLAPFDLLAHQIVVTAPFDLQLTG